MKKSRLHQKDTKGNPQDTGRLWAGNKKGGVCTPPSKRSEKPNLLHFDNSAGFGQLLGTMNAVPTNFVSLFANVLRGLLYALKAIEEKKGEAA